MLTCLINFSIMKLIIAFVSHYSRPLIAREIIDNRVNRYLFGKVLYLRSFPVSSQRRLLIRLEQRVMFLKYCFYAF